MGTRESIRKIKLGGLHRNTNILKWLWIQTWMKIVFCDVCRGKQDSHKTRFQTLCHVSEWFDNFSALFITSIILFTSAFISWISESVIFHLKAQTNLEFKSPQLLDWKNGFEARMGPWFSQGPSLDFLAIGLNIVAVMAKLFLVPPPGLTSFRIISSELNVPQTKYFWYFGEKPTWNH